MKNLDEMNFSFVQQKIEIIFYFWGKNPNENERTSYFNVTLLLKTNFNQRN